LESLPIATNPGRRRPVNEKKFLSLTLTKEAGSQIQDSGPPAWKASLSGNIHFSPRLTVEERIIDRLVQGLLKKWNKD